MKIRSFKSICDGVYQIKMYTEDWSQGDMQRVHRFGDPLVALGGTFVIWPAIAGTHTSSQVTASIVDSTKNQHQPLDFKSVDLVGRPVQNLSQNFWGLVSGSTTDPATTIPTAIPAGSLWVIGDAYLLPVVDFVLSDKYRHIWYDSPFCQEFDERDYGTLLVMSDGKTYAAPSYHQPVAELMADAWALAMAERLEDAVTLLRSREDDYTAESVDTI